MSKRRRRFHAMSHLGAYKPQPEPFRLVDIPWSVLFLMALIALALMGCGDSQLVDVPPPNKACVASHTERVCGRGCSDIQVCDRYSYACPDGFEMYQMRSERGSEYLRCRMKDARP